MEVLVLDGKSYVKASKAARDLGYATDYVGQLCRTGQVDAHLIGRTWYVDPEHLGTHRVEKKRMSRAKAREQAKKLIIAQRGKTVSLRDSKTAKNIAISYEGDESPLIPETRKLTIATEHPRTFTDLEDSEEIQETVIENKGEKVLMSGDIDVVDVTDEPLESDTVILRPKLIRSRPSDDDEVPERHASKHETRHLSVSEEAVTPEEDIMEGEGTEEHVVQTPFAEKVARLTISQDVGEEDQYPERKRVSTQKDIGGEKYSYFMHLSMHVIVLIIVLTSFTMSLNLDYDANRTELLRSEWAISVQEALTLFSERL